MQLETPGESATEADPLSSPAPPLPPLHALLSRGDGSTACERSPEVARADAILSEMLSEGAADPLAVNERGETALHLAARFNRANAVKILLAHLKTEADCNAIDLQGRTPLLAAAAGDCLESFVELARSRLVQVDHPGAPSSDPEAAELGLGGHNALVTAIRSHAVSVVHYILDQLDRCATHVARAHGGGEGLNFELCWTCCFPVLF